jgi:DNA-binding MarR family transcriptional regulator
MVVRFISFWPVSQAAAPEDKQTGQNNIWSDYMQGSAEIIDNILHLQEKINSLVLTYKADNWMRLDLTIDQLKSLIFIQNQGKISFNELARALGITRSNITGIADRLEQNGLVARRRNTSDRRIQYLVLTDKGRELLSTIRQKVRGEERRVLEALNGEELTALEKGLSALIREAENAVSNRNKNRLAGLKNSLISN